MAYVHMIEWGKRGRRSDAGVAPAKVMRMVGYGGRGSDGFPQMVVFCGSQE